MCAYQSNTSAATGNAESNRSGDFGAAGAGGCPPLLNKPIFVMTRHTHTPASQSLNHSDHRPKDTGHRRLPLRPNESEDCGVYALELDPSVALEPAFIASNPKYITGRECFYVGMSSLRPEERAIEHLQGIKNVSRIAHIYGKRLRMDLVENLKRVRRTFALQREKRLARELRSQGFGVWQA